MHLREILLINRLIFHLLSQLRNRKGFHHTSQLKTQVRSLLVNLNIHPLGSRFLDQRSNQPTNLTSIRQCNQPDNQGVNQVLNQLSTQLFSLPFNLILHPHTNQHHNHLSNLAQYLVDCQVDNLRSNLQSIRLNNLNGILPYNLRSSP